jgi:hypothetical protein
MFKDYYSILGISFPSNDEEIKRAYNAKLEALGPESIDDSNPNYRNREDVEEAYMVLGTSYSLKIAYDEEYQKAVDEGFDIYEIKDGWLLSKIERERCFVKNNRLKQQTSSPRKKRNMGLKVLGCLGKIFLVYICLYLFVFVKKCSRDRVRESYTSEIIPESKESADLMLKRFAAEENTSYPKDLNDNITAQAVLIESDALVYVFKVDDIAFAERKDQIVSRENQLGNIRNVYNEMKPMIDLLIETHRGISYRYICRVSGEITECKIPYTDLLNLK